MDWRKIDAVVEQGNVVSGEPIGDSVWANASERLRTKVFKAEKAVCAFMPESLVYMIYCYRADGSFVNSMGGKDTGVSYKLPDDASQVIIVMRRKDNPSLAVTPAEVTNFAVWTAGEAEIGEDEKGYYTKGRNLLTGSKAVTLTATGETEGTFAPVTPQTDFCKTVRGRKIRISMEVAMNSPTSGTNATFHRALFELHLRDGVTTSTNNYPLSFVFDPKSGRFYSETLTVPDHPLSWVSSGLYIQGLGSGTVTLSKPMITIGDEIYPWSSAPEDEGNPTEAV